MSIGVEVTTSLRSGPTNPGVPSGVLHIAAVTAKGPTSRAVLVTSLAQYQAVFGGLTPSTADGFFTAAGFFEEGGAKLAVSRLVGPAATKGVLTLKDTAGVDTVKVEAVDPGPASTDLHVTTFTTDAGFTVRVVSAETEGVLAEFTGLSSPADLVAAAAGNPVVKLTSLGSTTTAPGNNPAVITDVALSAGTDDRGSITTQTVLDALDRNGGINPGGAVAAPGWSATQVGAGLLAHSRKHNTVALLAGSVTDTPTTLANTADTLSKTGDGEYGALFHPWLTIPDGTRTRNVSPEGAIAGVRARVHQNGFWRIPAGDPGVFRWVKSTVIPVDTALNNTLAKSLVNGIATRGTRVGPYNWSSLSTDRDNLGFLAARDVLNNLNVAITAALEPFVWSVIDYRQHLVGQVEAAVVGVLDPIAKADGFFPLPSGDGTSTDPGYSVSVDTSIGSPTVVGANELVVRAAVRLAPYAQLISVEIIKVALTASV